MRVKKRQLSRTIRRSIKVVEQGVEQGNEAQPGAIGAAAVAAAAERQLDRFAEDIRAFLEDSQMDTILNRLESEFGPDLSQPPHLRISKD